MGRNPVVGTFTTKHNAIMSTQVVLLGLLPLLAAGVALGATIEIIEGLKSATNRTRPNVVNDRSLPSGHASTTATAWARIEAGKHHPPDVLRGAALGNFVAIFTTRTFLHPVLGKRAAMNMAPLSGGGVMIFGLVY